ncbi:caspase recruitment domain-containing protein 19-like isoform X2 [Siniperca chuatsi]|uniref:caspase recruitment domain-containing protein 19-like isoform X2 n=1 Tax=Siniperca chuatsi TaxID=119488 RepID=UPI001CE0F7D6|nr:caspase recruitment domain-containing protein 19-like isoform X2 [Siniperca chuatsi]
MTDIDDYHEQLRRDAHFLCSDQRMDTELVDRLVLQLNRIHPQILNDKEAHRFRNLSVPTKVRLAELLKHLHGKGEEACHEFYRGLHIHAEDVYSSLPTRVTQRGKNTEQGFSDVLVTEDCHIELQSEMADPKWTYNVAIYPDRYVLNDYGPLFFLSCFSFVVGIAMLYYYREGETLRCSGPLLQRSAARLSEGAKNVLISCAEVGKQKK